MSSVKFANPWGLQHPATLGRFDRFSGAHRKAEINIKRGPMINAGFRVQGRTTVPMGVNRTRFAAGDPSWLSQFIKHNSKIIGGIASTVAGLGGTLIAGPVGGAAAAAATSAAFRPKAGGPRLSGNPSTAAPNLSLQAFRPGATRGTGKGAGMTAALAPLPPTMMLSQPDPSSSDPSGLAGLFGGLFDTPTDSGVPDNTPTDGQGNPAPIVAIPSSGGGSMLFHHFFGKSNSKAIPVAQTNGMRPSGYHLNKHGYYLASIATWLPPGSVWVKGRRRNPLNPRALHRSIARLISAKHAVKKLGMLEVPKRRHHVRRFGARPAMKRLKAG